MLNVFAHELAQCGKLQPTEEDVFAAVTDVHNRCVGGYAVVAMITGYGIVGFRDPHGIRPIVFGQRHTDEGVEYMIASESVSLDVLGFTLVRDLAPRSEEHTSELQSLMRISYAVFCLKKTRTTDMSTQTRCT